MAGATAIHNASELQAMSNATGSYYLCNNISLNAPIGMLFPNGPFNGTLDGNGKTISGLVLTNQSDLIVGLVRIVGLNGTIRNLALDSPDVHGYGLVGVVSGINGGAITNVTINGGTVTSTATLAGALVGVNARGTLTGSSATASVNGGAPGVPLIGANQP